MMAPVTTSPDLLSGSLPGRAYDNLRGLNPHWEGRPGPPIPNYRRRLFEHLYRGLGRGLTPVIVLRGPRRVGKTVLLRQVIDQLLRDGVVATRILYVPFDDIGSLTGIAEPVLALARWYEKRVLGRSFNEAARAGAPAYL